MPDQIDTTAPGFSSRFTEPFVPLDISQSPHARGDRAFKSLVALAAGVVPLVAVAMLVMLWQGSLTCFKTQGWSFFVTQVWDPVHENYGMVAFAYGTLVSSLIGLVIAAPGGVGIALAITEFTHSSVRELVAWMVEILAAVPSVIFGLWGLFVLAPFSSRYLQPLLAHIPGPFFRPTGTGLSLFTAGLVVAVMILPTVMAVCREVFNAVPVSMRESALALGATRWETVRLAVLGPSTTGIVGAVILGMGRALGETMAVTMVIGNRAHVSMNLLAPADTLASVIANQYAEAVSPSHLSSLTALGFVLFLITMLLNLGARLLVWLVARRMEQVSQR